MLFLLLNDLRLVLDLLLQLLHVLLEVGDLQLLLLQLLVAADLDIFFLGFKLKLQLLLLLFKLVDLFLKHLNVQFQLLLNFYVVSHLCLVDLQLALVLLGRQVERLGS